MSRWLTPSTCQPAYLHSRQVPSVMSWRLLTGQEKPPDQPNFAHVMSTFFKDSFDHKISLMYLADIVWVLLIA
jgi:hypothetical protein